MKIKNLIPVTGDMQGTFVVDNSLVGEYNSKNNTNYTSLPEEVLSTLTITPAIVKEGNTESEDGIKVSCPDEIAQQLGGAYVLPLRLKTTFANGNAVDEDDIVYVTIDVKETLINDNATSIPGTKGDVKTYSVVSAENLDPEEFSGLFSDDWNASWPFLEKKETAAFTVDLGAEKNLVAFNIDNYVGKEYTLYFSNDGNTWKEIGSTEGHTAVYDRSTWEQAYVMYGAVKCRYIKAKMKLDTNSWAWSYGSYAAISALNFYFK